MSMVRIQEFSLSTTIEYLRPVVFGDSRLDGVAKALALLPFGDFLKPTEISIAKQNDLFAYTLSVPMFNGSASIVINAMGITVAFKQGRNKEHFDLMKKLTLAALETGKVGEVKRSLLSFEAHAVFEPHSGYLEHMKRFTDLSSNVISGGVVLVTKIPEIEGELRYASENSLAYPQGLFFATNAVCKRDVTPDLFDLLATKFEASAALEEVGFLKS